MIDFCYYCVELVANSRGATRLLGIKLGTIESVHAITPRIAHALLNGTGKLSHPGIGDVPLIAITTAPNGARVCGLHTGTPKM